MVPSVASEKIPYDTTGNRSRDTPTSSAVPLPLRYRRQRQHGDFHNTENPPQSQTRIVYYLYQNLLQRVR
jgi:hypothetical protein